MLIACGVIRVAASWRSCPRPVSASRRSGVDFACGEASAKRNAIINIRRLAGVHPKISDRPAVALCAVFCDSLPCHAVSRAAWSSIVGSTLLCETFVYNIFALLRCVLGVDTGALGSPPTCSSQERGGAMRQSLVVAVFVLGEDGDPLAQRYPACFSFSRCSQQSCFLACFDFLYHFHFLALALALPLACSCSVGTL